MVGELMQREMAEQPKVLQRIVDSVGSIRARVRSILSERLDGIAFVARGSSDNVAMLGRYAPELAARRPAGLAAPSLHTRYGSPVDYHGYLVIGGHRYLWDAPCERCGSGRHNQRRGQ
jgi:glucosamine--fructose-6-phosphate aminotransferase (isomerizing)